MSILTSIKRFYNKIFSKRIRYTNTGNIYVISDTHLNHSNIIRYCNRPFKNVQAMNLEIARRWNRTVNKNDTVYFLGDFVFRGSIGYWITHLNGKKIFIRGNHDSKLKNAIHNKIINYKGHQFYLVHEPHEIPKDWQGWAIYGHKHNSNLSKFPFIDGERKRINVSVEVIDYRPVSLDYLISLNLAAIRRKTTIHSTTEYW
jgi:calcineurin-like phosphoesterase family protein